MLKLSNQNPSEGKGAKFLNLARAVMSWKYFISQEKTFNNTWEA